MHVNRTVKTSLRGRALLAEPRLNKSTAFSAAERCDLDIEGLLPNRIEKRDLRTAVPVCAAHIDRHRLPIDPLAILT